LPQALGAPALVLLSGAVSVSVFWHSSHVQTASSSFFEGRGERPDDEELLETALLDELELLDEELLLEEDEDELLDDRDDELLDDDRLDDELLDGKLLPDDNEDSDDDDTLHRPSVPGWRRHEGTEDVRRLPSQHSVYRIACQKPGKQISKPSPYPSTPANMKH
jgi:hypothetical protein